MRIREGVLVAHLLFEFFEFVLFLFAVFFDFFLGFGFGVFDSFGTVCRGGGRLGGGCGWNGREGRGTFARWEVLVVVDCGGIGGSGVYLFGLFSGLLSRPWVCFSGGLCGM